MTTLNSSYDVIVVGSGAAGCSAAISAHLNGARRVLVAEKSGRMVGGTTRLAGGGWIWVPNNPFLIEKGVKEPVENIVKLMKSWSGWTNDKNDEELMYAFAREAPVAVADLMSRGMYVCNPVELRSDEDRDKVRNLIRSKLKENPEACRRAGVTERSVETLCSMMPSYCCENMHDCVPVGKVLQPTGRGGGTSKQLERAARKCKGVDIHKGCVVTGLLVGPRREITGVTLKSGRKIEAKMGVIFASGGFASNAEMIRAHFGERSIRGTCAAPTNTGDFMQILKRDLGMACENLKLSRAWVKQTVLPFSRKRNGVFFLNADSAFVVDRTGQRFQNEKHHYQERGNFMLDHLDTHRLVFFVFDSRAREMYAGPIRGLGGPIPMLGQGQDCIVSGNTISELSSNLRTHLSKHIDDSFELSSDFEANLELTTTRFNRYAETGIDPEFRRGENAGDYTWHLVGRAEDNKYPNKTMHPLKPTYHCLVLGISLLDTKAGPRIDRKARVLDEKSVPIKNLYGAGNCVHSSSNRSYWSAGCTISHAMTFGYVAGRECVLGSASKM